MVDYTLASNQEIYNVFNKAYSEDRASFDDLKPLYNYFKSLYQLYKDGHYYRENILINMRKSQKDLKELLMGIQNNWIKLIKKGFGSSKLTLSSGIFH